MPTKEMKFTNILANSLTIGDYLVRAGEKKHLVIGVLRRQDGLRIRLIEEGSPETTAFWSNYGYTQRVYAYVNP